MVRMQQEGKNMFAVRRELEISSLRTKIETRTLQRIGHVLRMPDHRLTKKVVLGRWTEERQQKGLLRGGIIAYWKRLFRESGLDWTKASGLVSDRKKWKEIVRKRNKEMTTWEEEMSEWRRTEAKPLRVKTFPKNDHSCGVENCSFVAKSTAGLAQHIRLKHAETKKVFKCSNCARTFKQKGALTNHSRACVKTAENSDTRNLRKRKECHICKAIISSCNYARHLRGQHNA